MAHLIEAVRGLASKGVDATTPGGTLVFHFFGALAQLERDLIRERT